MPEPTLQSIAQQVADIEQRIDAIAHEMDMLIELAPRVERNINAIREDLRSFNQAEVERRA